MTYFRLFLILAIIVVGVSPELLAQVQKSSDPTLCGSAVETYKVLLTEANDRIATMNASYDKAVRELATVREELAKLKQPAKEEKK